MKFNIKNKSILINKMIFLYNCIKIKSYPSLYLLKFESIKESSQPNNLNC